MPLGRIVFVTNYEVWSDKKKNINSLQYLDLNNTQKRIN